MDKGKIIQLSIGMLMLIMGVYSIVSGSIIGIGTQIQASRYISFENNPIEFLFMVVLHFTFGVWLLVRLKK